MTVNLKLQNASYNVVQLIQNSRSQQHNTRTSVVAKRHRCKLTKS